VAGVAAGGVGCAETAPPNARTAAAVIASFMLLPFLGIQGRAGT
jgi:hypothetical protein